MLKYMVSTFDVNLFKEKYDCMNPHEKFCGAVVRGNRSLLMEKAHEVTDVRETIFVRKRWDEHKTKAIRVVTKKWRDCMESGDYTYLKDSVFEYLKEQNQLVNDRVKYDGVSYLVPQMFLNDTQIMDKVDDVSKQKARLCCYEMQKQYPYVIDRMYIEYAVNETVMKSGKALLMKTLNTTALNLQEFRTLRDDDYTNEEKTMLESFIGTLTRLRVVKAGYPPMLMNDTALEELYETKAVPQAQMVMKEPPTEAWALPIYPDAVWLNREENALYVTPLFFDELLFSDQLPEAWNLGAFFRVMQTITRETHVPDAKFNTLMFHYVDHAKITRYLKDPLQMNFPDNSTSVTLYLDITAYSILSLFMQYSKELRGGELTNIGLYHFRVYHDMCFHKPKNDYDKQLFINSTGRIHNYYALQFYQINKRRGRNCPSHVFT